MATAKVKKQPPHNNESEVSDPDDIPMTGNERKTIDRPVTEQAECYEKIGKVAEAIKGKNYNLVQNLFTPEGWEIFSIMTESSEMRIAKMPDKFTVEESNLFLIGKGIPVSIKLGGHLSNETLVFRFDKQSGLIKSVAYALTKRAEDDIFRQAQWNIESRYSLLTFMEDYQTAFVLKRLDYIKSIFSDDAVIITGKFTDGKPSKRFYDATTLNLDNRNVQYSRMDKETYIKRLQEDFFDHKNQRYKKYIKLTFEDAVISKVATGGFAEDHDVMWIEIKQNYESDKYNDKGYLSLQINLRPTGSQINVRTWTPQFMEIEDLKKRFEVGFDF